MSNQHQNSGKGRLYAQDAAGELAVSVRTILKWVKKGKLGADGYIGRSPFFKPGRLEEYMREEVKRRRREHLAREKMRQRSKESGAQRRAAKRRGKQKRGSGEEQELAE